VQQVIPLTDKLEGNLGFTIVYLGDRASTFVTDAPNATRPRILMPEYTTVDVRGGLTFDRVWSVNVYARNLFDKRGVAAADNRNGVNVPTALFIQPRTLGVTLARTFRVYRIGEGSRDSRFPAVAITGFSRSHIDELIATGEIRILRTAAAP